MILRNRLIGLIPFLSGFLLALSFLFPLVIGPLVYVGLLYYKHKTSSNTFFDGFVWGLCFFGLHSAGLFYVVYYDGSGPLRMLYPIVFVVYFALHSGVWLAVTRLVKGDFECAWWILCTLFFAWYLDTYFLWPLGVVEGYPLVFPTIPLVVLSHLIYINLWHSPWELLLCIIFLQVSFVEGFFKKRWWIVTTFCLASMCWGDGKKGGVEQPRPGWFGQLQYIRPPKERYHKLEAAQELCQTMLKKKRESFQLFITPESAFPFFLQIGPSTKLWQDYALNSAALLVSAHKINEGEVYNTVFLISQRRIILSYSKSHLIPLFERTRTKESNKNKDFFKFFLLKGNPFSPSKNQTPLISHSGIGPFLPVICSELFWLKYSLRHPTVPLICVLNDSYFGFTRFSYIMLLSARFKGISQERWIVYCGWNYAFFISPKGLISDFN